MKFSTIASGVALAASAMATPAQLDTRQSSKTPAISVKGNAFFRPDGSRFYIRGVDYQPGGASDPVDPLANPANCKRDIKEFQKLGLNTIRIYTVDNTADHDECMKELSAAGIYLALDVNNGKYSLNRATPKPSYNDVYLQSVFSTIDQFSKYDNTLLFFSGNEVINAADNSNCAPYIKAVTRDMKAYIKARKYRSIPVGYSAADVEENRYQTAAYMNCGSDDERSDFFSFNDYSWCGDSSFKVSGWNQKVEQYKNYSIPLFLSEYGCNKVTPRPFSEVEALYSPEMTSVYSGGLVYEYSNEPDNPDYGLVTIQGQNGLKELTDFNNLMKQLKSTPSPTGDGGAQTSLKALQCPQQSKNWQVDSSKGLPIMPVPAKQYMKAGAGTGPGLKGAGSQWAGTQSPGWSTTSSSSSSSGSDGASSTSGSAASSIHPSPMALGPMVCALVVVASTFLGASLL